MEHFPGNMQIESLLQTNVFVFTLNLMNLELICVHTLLIGTNSEKVPIRDYRSFLFHIVWGNSMCGSCFDCSERLECLETKARFWTHHYNLLRKKHLYESILLAFTNIMKRAWWTDPTSSYGQAVFGGVVSFCVQTWCIKRKGPVFVAIFKPLGIGIAAIMGVIFLGDTLYIGR